MAQCLASSVRLNVTQLDDVPAIRRGDRFTLCLPTDQAQQVSLQESFYEAFVGSLKLPMGKISGAAL
jgi:hypothetical protein